jgi:hypothetical protein
MGMFDSVMVPCPHCGAHVECQTKDGPCDLELWPLHDAPDWAVKAIMDRAYHCGQCDGWFCVVDRDRPLEPPPPPQAIVRKVRPPENPRLNHHAAGVKGWPDDRVLFLSDLMP